MQNKTVFLTQKQLLEENAGLRAQLEEAQDTLRAIQNGEVDALVVSGEDGEQIFTLKGAERPYRLLIENMNEGALTLTAEGVILYANQCFSEMLKTPLEQVIGSAISTWVVPDDHEILWALLRDKPQEKRRQEMVLSTGDGNQVAVNLSVNLLSVDELPDYFGLVATDLTEQKKHNAAMIAAEKLKHELLEERQRLAHDLHDAVNQTLFAVSLIADVLPKVWEKDPAEAKRSNENLRRLTKGALAEMRTLLAELRPATLIEEDLSDLLRELGVGLEGRTTLKVVVTIKDRFCLPPDVQMVFYHVCREVLNIIALQTNDSRVEIQLEPKADILELCIHCDGAGFDPEWAFSNHAGLILMSNRAKAENVQLTSTTHPKLGGDVMLRWRGLTK